MQNLAVALRGLDPNNDNHWTTDGSPRLETVRLLAGDPSVTREALNAAAPGFSRATVGMLGAGQGGSTTPAPETAPAGVQGASQGSGNGEQGDEVGNDADAQGEASTGSDEALAAAEKKLADALAVQEEAKRGVSEAQAEVDHHLQARELEGGAMAAHAVTVQGYLERQQQNLEERRKRREALKGIDVRDLLPQRAPLDNAFARKTARGTQRPLKV